MMPMTTIGLEPAARRPRRDILGALQALLKGQLDLAIASNPARDRRITLTSLFTDEFCAVVAPDHPPLSEVLEPRRNGNGVARSRVGSAA
jgi:DNA-binding transcriptional LysR family regulator